MRTHRPAYALARGQRIGVRMDSAPIEANTTSKLLVNLVSRSWMRNRKRREGHQYVDLAAELARRSTEGHHRL